MGNMTISAERHVERIRRFEESIAPATAKKLKAEERARELMRLPESKARNDELSALKGALGEVDRVQAALDELKADAAAAVAILSKV